MRKIKPWESAYEKIEFRRDRYYEEPPQVKGRCLLLEAITKGQSVTIIHPRYEEIPIPPPIAGSWYSMNWAWFPMKPTKQVDTFKYEELRSFLHEHRLKRINSGWTTRGYTIVFSKPEFAIKFRLFWQGDTEITQ